MIRSENIRKVIDNLKRALPIAMQHPKTSLCMCVPSVNLDNPCGTPHCHGGWYAIACRDRIPAKPFFVNYRDGAALMATDLGLKYMCDVLDYMDQLPVLWGNEWGATMFSSSIAFYHPIKRPNGAENLQHIIDHWEEVYLRVFALENPIEITESPVTTEELLEEQTLTC